jgi:hypothetical protein
VFGLALTRVFNTRRASEPDAMFGPGWVSSAIVADAASGYTELTVVGSLVQIGLPDDSVIGFTQHNATNTTFDPQVGMPSAVGHDDPPSHDRRGRGRVGPPGAVVDLANTMKWSQKAEIATVRRRLAPAPRL